MESRWLHKSANALTGGAKQKSVVVVVGTDSREVAKGHQIISFPSNEFSTFRDALNAGTNNLTLLTRRENCCELFFGPPSEDWLGLVPQIVVLGARNELCAHHIKVEQNEGVSYSLTIYCFVAACRLMNPKCNRWSFRTNSYWRWVSAVTRVYGWGTRQRKFITRTSASHAIMWITRMKTRNKKKGSMESWRRWTMEDCQGNF